MPSVLTINGAVLNRVGAAVTLDRLRIGIDAPDELEWTQIHAALTQTWPAGASVSLALDGANVFTGAIVSCHPGRDPETGGILAGYRALGLKYLANTIAVTNPNDLSGTIVYNLPPDDPNYIPSESGLSVGQILSLVFQGHASALASVGITGFNAADLAALVVVPPTPVYFQGSKLWNEVDDLLAKWCNQFAAYIPANGVIRVVDTRAMPSLTLTLDRDPIDLASFSRDITDCATQVVVRGSAYVEPAYLSLSDGTLTEAFTAADKANWNYSDYTDPQGAVDDGSLTNVTSNQVTVQSSSATATWAANSWSSIEAWIYLINPLGSGLTQTEARRITANTALAAGGTSVITLDRPLSNNGYTKYHIVGQPAGISNCWRLYNITNPYVASHLVSKFAMPVPWRTSDSVTLTSYPTGTICWSSNGQPPDIEVPATFEVMPLSGRIRFTEPVVRAFGTLTNLQTGGSSTDGIPADILALVPYSRGALTAAAPATGWAGTAYTQDGLMRTLYADVPTWIDPGDESSMQQLAQAILNTVMDAVVEGTIVYEGKFSQGLTLGQSLNIAGNGYATGWETLAAPIRRFEIEWPKRGATSWVSRIDFSTRRRPFTGDRLYTHPAYSWRPHLGL